MNWLIVIFVLFLILYLFGSLFTAFVRLIGPFGVIVLLGFLAYRFFTANKQKRIYDGEDDAEEEINNTGEDTAARRRVHADTAPRHETKHEHPEAANVASDEREIEEAVEVVDLPQSALRKEE
ncbi:MAG: hypothetical protein Q4E17_01675 [Synergistes sp.]|nr:hypothetical protein [Synergistes sp.]